MLTEPSIVTSDFQSDGRCNQNCTSYAFAIVREKSCWCSNLIPNPDDQKPIADCNIPCPGYPSDLCGGINLWGYMEISANEPTGTAPAGIGLPTSAAPTKTSSSSSVRKPAPSSPAISHRYQHVCPPCFFFFLFFSSFRPKPITALVTMDVPLCVTSETERLCRAQSAPQ